MARQMAFSSALSSKGLRKKTGGSGLDRPGANVFVAMGRDHNDRKLGIAGCQTPLQLDPADARHTQIEHDAALAVGPLVGQEILGSSKGDDGQAGRSHETAERSANRSVVVNDEDQRSWVGGGVLDEHPLTIATHLECQGKSGLRTRSRKTLVLWNRRGNRAMRPGDSAGRRTRSTWLTPSCLRLADQRIGARTPVPAKQTAL